MKLASLKSDLDGELVVVSRDLKKMRRVPEIAPTLQAAFDDWAAVKSCLEQAYRRLMAGEEPAEDFSEGEAHSPLPRAYQWLDSGVYRAHFERMRRGQPIPDWLETEPSLYQGGSDGFLTPTGDVRAVSEDWGIDFEGEVAVITDGVPYGTKAADAEKHIQLVMLCNDVSNRILQGHELQRAFGFIHGKPASAFSPVAVTPDELGDAWRDNRLHLPLRCHVNGELFGDPGAGDMMHGFNAIIAYAARTRALLSGSIIGGGTVANADPKRGHATIAEKRSVEELASGAPKTPFLRFGDRVRIEMLDRDGRSIFGAIDQKVVRA
jgi:fumarylacetoacetate (FAA) hydrolase